MKSEIEREARALSIERFNEQITDNDWHTHARARMHRTQSKKGTTIGGRLLAMMMLIIIHVDNPLG